METRILDNIWSVYTLFPQNDECGWVQENKEDQYNLEQGDLENLFVENPDEENGEKSDKKDQEEPENLENLDEGDQESLNEVKQENSNMCRSLLKSSQSIMRLAVLEWNGLLLKMNRRCRTKVLRPGVENEWGETKTKMGSFQEFQENQLSENSNRQKRNPLLGIVGVFIAAGLVGLIAYAVSSRVVTDKLGEVEKVMEKTDEVMLQELNKTNQEVKAIGEELSNVRVRVNALEKYGQLQEFGHQSLLAAKLMGKFLFSKLYLQEEEFSMLDLQFSDVFLEEVAGLEEKERDLELFKLKQTSNYFSWIDHEEDFLCNSSSVITIMSLTVLESDSTVYRKINSSDGYRRHEDDKITYFNEFGMTVMEEDMTVQNKLEPGRSLLANRRFTSVDDTRLIFTESTELNDRFTVFFLRDDNSTEERMASIKCSSAPLQAQRHRFKSGSSIDLPIFCSIESYWLNATAIQIKTSNTTTLGDESFQMNWRPIPSPTDKNNTCFDGSIQEAVEKLHSIREDFRRSYKRISTEDLLNSVVIGVQQTVSLGEKMVNHVLDHGPKYGLGAISLMALLVSFSVLYKMRGSSSAVENGYLL